MIASNKKYYLSYFNKLVLMKNTYLCLVFSLTENIEINLKRLNLKLVIESGLLSKRIFLVKVTQNIGKKKYLLLILCWKLILGCIKLKI